MAKHAYIEHKLAMLKLKSIGSEQAEVKRIAAF